MNGTAIDRSLDSLKEMKKSKQTNSKQFCIDALNNKKCMKYYDYTYRYKDEISLIEKKLSQNEIDDEAISIAQMMFDTMEEQFGNTLQYKINDFMKSVRKRINRYRSLYIFTKMLQHFLQILVIIGATSLPFLLNIFNSSKETITYISIAVAVSAALLKIYNFGDNINNLYQVIEKYQFEYNQFETDRGPYKDIKGGESLDLFMDRIDTLRHEQNELSLSFAKTIHNQMNDEIEKIKNPV